MESADETAKRQRTYMRGLYDGMKAAGIQYPREFMNSSRMREAEKNLSGIARKILEAVPLDAEVVIHRIHARLVERGTKADYKTIEGCLDSLREKGLVKEPSTGSFIRVTILDKVQSPAPEEATIKGLLSLSKDFQTRPIDPLGRLSQVAAVARSIAEQLMKLATEIEESALSFEEKLQAINADSAKLAQLRSLLKSVNGE